jgi:hypothetical protein
MMMMMMIYNNITRKNRTCIAELKLKWFFRFWMIHYFVSEDRLHCKHSDECEKKSYEINS